MKQHADMDNRQPPTEITQKDGNAVNISSSNATPSTLAPFNWFANETKHQHTLPRGTTREQLKTAEDRAEDLAYTVNHAVACTLTDFIDPYVNQFIQNKGADYAPNFLKPLLAKFHLGCGHDHNHHVNGWQVWIPEIAGDFGSVPVAVAAQRYAPGAMHLVEDMLKPLVGPAFRKSAEEATRRWATRRAIPNNTEEYKQHVEEIYNHEMSHLPQALLWTISTIGINAVTQRAMGNKNPWSAMIFGKAGGALVTSAGVITARVLTPKSMRDLDKWTTRNIIAPTTRHAGRVMGISDEAINHVLEHQEDVQDTSGKSAHPKAITILIFMISTLCLGIDTYFTNS